MNPEMKKLGAQLQRLVIIRPSGFSEKPNPTITCTVCQAIDSGDGEAQHVGDCPVGDILEAYQALARAHPSQEFAVPNPVSVTGVYSNLITLLSLSHLLNNSGVIVNNDVFTLNNTINGTIGALVKQLKGHVKGRSVIDQVLEVVESAKSKGIG
jgi:hypothetical protein